MSSIFVLMAGRLNPGRLNQGQGSGSIERKKFLESGLGLSPDGWGR